VIDLDRLAGWMDGLGLAGQGEPIEHRFVSGGTQNEIYEIRRGGLRCAMRIPPPAAPAISLVAGNRKERAAHPRFARRS
jgi:hypothetical protein